MKFVQQPTHDTCTSACLAMITGKPVEQVIAEYDHLHKSGESNSSIYLDENKIAHVEGGLHGWVATCGLHLLCVPSLNIVGGLHNILLLVWESEEKGVFCKQIFDPAMGREGKKYYTMQDNAELPAVTLYSYILEASIIDYQKYIGGEE